MEDDILRLILMAEEEYQGVVKKSVIEAENYVDQRKKDQGAGLDELNRQWYMFEEVENAKLEKAILEAEQRMKTELSEKMEQLRACQALKIGVISERLKKGVLSLNGNS